MRGGTLLRIEGEALPAMVVRSCRGPDIWSWDLDGLWTWANDIADGEEEEADAVIADAISWEEEAIEAFLIRNRSQRTELLLDGKKVCGYFVELDGETACWQSLRRLVVFRGKLTIEPADRGRAVEIL